MKGIVEIYPALNPLGVTPYPGGIPMFDLDMTDFSREAVRRIRSRTWAAKIVEDIAGADVCV